MYWAFICLFSSLCFLSVLLSALSETSVTCLLFSNLQFPYFCFVESQNSWHMNELAKKKVAQPVMKLHRSQSPLVQEYFVSKKCKLTSICMFSAQRPDFHFYATELNDKLCKILCLDKADSRFLSFP